MVFSYTFCSAVGGPTTTSTKGRPPGVGLVWVRGRSCLDVVALRATLRRVGTLGTNRLCLEDSPGVSEIQ